MLQCRMVSNIRVIFKRDAVDEETTLNLHRFGTNISQSIKAGFLPTEMQIAIATLFASFELIPAYPLNPNGTVVEMLQYKIDPVQDNSWDSYVRLGSACTKEIKAILTLQLLIVPYIESFKDVNF